MREFQKELFWKSKGCNQLCLHHPSINAYKVEELQQTNF